MSIIAWNAIANLGTNVALWECMYDCTYRMLQTNSMHDRMTAQRTATGLAYRVGVILFRIDTVTVWRVLHHISVSSRPEP